MSNLAAALEWKYGPVAGTAGDRIVSWRHPNLPEPDQTQIDQDILDYQAAKPDIEAVREVDGLKALKALVIWLAPLVGKTPAQARDEIIAIYKEL